MNPRLEKVLADLEIELWFRDELPPNPRGWAQISDVACSRARGAVAVPRRRRDAYHYAEVLHEVAHLQIWRWTGKSPASHYEPNVCQLAIDIATEFGFGKPTLDWLHDELKRVFAEATFVRVVTL